MTLLTPHEVSKARIVHIQSIRQVFQTQRLGFISRSFVAPQCFSAQEEHLCHALLEVIAVSNLHQRATLQQFGTFRNLVKEIARGAERILSPTMRVPAGHWGVVAHLCGFLLYRPDSW